MHPYADTNFLVSLYLDVGMHGLARQQVGEAAAAQTDVLPITHLLWAEVTNAFQLHTYFARNGGQWRVTSEMAAYATGSFETQLSEHNIFTEADVSWTELRAEFRALSLRHTAKHGFRTYDVLHVPSARLLGCDEFWSFDGKARQLAELEGLRVNVLA